jgi:hypothetical protein
MRPRLLALALLLVSLPLSAQRAIRPKDGPPKTPPGLNRCCATKVYDADGKELGEVIKYDDRFQSIPLNAWVRYEVKGDSVAINVGPQMIQGPVGAGGSAIVFQAIDCSGDAFVSQLTYAPLTRRYGVVLWEGAPGGWPFQINHAWLYVTDPLPAPVNAGATVYKAQWTEQNQCTPYPAPGFSFSGPQYGYIVHKVEDLYVKFKRPYSIP